MASSIIAMSQKSDTLTALKIKMEHSKPTSTFDKACDQHFTYNKLRNVSFVWRVNAVLAFSMSRKLKR